MGLQNKNGIAYYTFDNLENTGLVNHCFTTRLGGVSKGDYESLNLSFTRGEDRKSVLKNYRLLCDSLGFDYDSFVLPSQTHTKNIRTVTMADKGKGITKPNDIKNTDGLMTDEKGLNLTIFGADCVPIFLLDTQKKAIAMIHAGWKGTALGIARESISKMQAQYGSNPRDILAGIGPSIGKCCFQVDEPVVNLFKENISFAEEIIFKDTIPNKFKIDLWECNKRLLMEVGVLEENIELSNACTMCNTEQFYSHRKMGNARGNMAGVMVIL